MPEGKLLCVHNGKYIKYYKSDGHHHEYLPKTQEREIQQLAYKQYLTSCLMDLMKEKQTIDAYLQQSQTHHSNTELLFKKNPHIQNLISDYYQSKETHLNDWINAPYEHNTSFQENLKFKTISNHMVRSKSEALIDTILTTHNIPFRYECALLLNNEKTFPDFTIKHPKTGALYYWEHLGLMDDESYSRKNIHKLDLYQRHQIIPFVNLILTFETDENPLDVNWVEKLVQYYFE